MKRPTRVNSAGLFFIFSILLLFKGSASGSESNWVKINTNYLTDAYLDTSSISRTKKRMHLVWIKLVARYDNVFSEDYEMDGIDHVLLEYEIDCGKNMYKLLVYRLFKKDDSLMGSEDFKNTAEFTPIPPDTVEQRVEEVICHHAK